ncbi:MAG: hypothetical protein JXA96_00880, partial [Sedimentisphaerales bacterium]|nr:hypothetical protein [Sedimentisphaerales bacterium]
MGDNYGTVTNCYSNGTVSGDRYVGGLVGYNYGTVTNCYSSATVSGYYYYVGGLVGTNSYGRWTNSYGSVSNCYSSGTVSGDQYVGGLVGSNDYGCSITNCYSTGTVSGDGNIGGLVGFGSDSWILYSVWDIETSGLSKSDGGVGLTTDQMMDPNILGLFGFTNNPNWVLDAGNDYMRLAWEDTPGQIIGEPVIDWMEGSGIEENPYKIGTA